MRSLRHGIYGPASDDQAARQREYNIESEKAFQEYVTKRTVAADAAARSHASDVYLDRIYELRDKLGISEVRQDTI